MSEQCSGRFRSFDWFIPIIRQFYVPKTDIEVDWFPTWCKLSIQIVVDKTIRIESFSAARSFKLSIPLNLHNNCSHLENNRQIYSLVYVITNDRAIDWERSTFCIDCCKWSVHCTLMQCKQNSSIVTDNEQPLNQKRHTQTLVLLFFARMNEISFTLSSVHFVFDLCNYWT